MVRFRFRLHCINKSSATPIRLDKPNTCAHTFYSNQLAMASNRFQNIDRQRYECDQTHIHSYMHITNLPILRCKRALHQLLFFSVDALWSFPCDILHSRPCASIPIFSFFFINSFTEYGVGKKKLKNCTEISWNAPSNWFYRNEWECVYFYDANRLY